MLGVPDSHLNYIVTPFSAASAFIDVFAEGILYCAPIPVPTKEAVISNPNNSFFIIIPLF